MKKIVFFMIIILIFLGCASTSPSGNPDVYIEKTLSDVINLNFKQSEGFLERRYQSWPEELTFRFVSLAYISLEKDYVILSDNSGNNITVYGTNDINQYYRLRENGDFDTKKLYQIYYRLEPRMSNMGKMYEIKNINIEQIGGLMSFMEFENVKNEERKRINQEETARRKAEAEATISGRYYGQITGSNSSTSYEFTGDKCYMISGSTRMLWGTFTVSGKDINIHITGGLDGVFDKPQFFILTLIDTNTISLPDGTLYKRR